MDFNDSAKFGKTWHSFLDLSSEELSTEGVDTGESLVQNEVTTEEAEQVAEVLLGLDQGGPVGIARSDVFDKQFTGLRRIIFKHVVAEMIRDVVWNLRSQVWRVKISRPQHIEVHTDVGDDALDRVLESLPCALTGLDQLGENVETDLADLLSDGVSLQRLPGDCVANQMWVLGLRVKRDQRLKNRRRGCPLGSSLLVLDGLTEAVWEEFQAVAERLEA